MVFVGTGIFLGGLVGLLSVVVWNVPLTLTASGGALVMGLVFGWLRSVYPFFGRIPEPAIWIFDTVGLCMFIGIVGLGAGPSFVSGLQASGISLVFVGFGLGLVASHAWDPLWPLCPEDESAHRSRRLRGRRHDYRCPASRAGRGAKQHSGARLHGPLCRRKYSPHRLGTGACGNDVDLRSSSGLIEQAREIEVLR